MSLEDIKKRWDYVGWTSFHEQFGKDTAKLLEKDAERLIAYAEACDEYFDAKRRHAQVTDAEELIEVLKAKQAAYIRVKAAREELEK